MIAFAALMFSSVMVLNQFGFMLCFAVLLVRAGRPQLAARSWPSG
jgi:hypothetical protein